MKGNKKPLITIIVPVYNAQDYLRECLSSIVNQTFDNFESIIVNDGSTDNSEKIIMDFLIDKRFRYYRKPNGGLSSARNFGLKKANGDFVTFVDSDDWIFPTYLEKLYKIIISSKSDISICNTTSLNKTCDSNGYIVFEKYEAMREVSKNELFQNYFPSKMFKRHLFDSLCFPDGKNFEDISLFYKIVYLSNRIVFDPSPLYFYRVNSTSISKNITYNRAFDYYTAVYEKYVFYKNTFEEFSINLIPEIINSFYLVCKTAKKKSNIVTTFPLKSISLCYKRLDLKRKIKYNLIKFFICNKKLSVSVL